MKKFAVFDIDGTLIRWQLYHAVVDKLAKKSLLDKAIYTEIRQARMSWKNREDNDSFMEYQDKVLEGFESAIQTISTADFDKAALEVIDEYKDQVYVYTRDLIRQLKSHGYFLIAISGSQKELVKQIADYYKFDDFVGSDYTRDGDRFSGDRQIASLSKKAHVTSMVAKHNLTTTDSYGVGDSQSDAVMLEMVENPIAFNPDQSLLKIAKSNHWNIVVERKNVIYKLSEDNGKYILDD